MLTGYLFSLVCFLPLSRYWLRSPSWTSSQMRMRPPISISRTFISFLPTPTYLAHQSLQNHPPSLHQDMPFWSTHFGS
ncbi:hypothetical protein BGW80DRAFT_1379017 [Lactifluus volemus]|nr:hypothetical protein BGW80DRAFT_1379017 [Lactifluus volemus]